MTQPKTRASVDARRSDYFFYRAGRGSASRQAVAGMVQEWPGIFRPLACVVKARSRRLLSSALHQGVFHTMKIMKLNLQPHVV